MQTEVPVCKQLTQVCTGERFGEIVIHNQHEIEITPDGHGVRFDVCLADENMICDVEMQVRHKSNLPKRSRYYQGMVDVDNFDRVEDYQNLRKSFIIFICLENPFKEKNLHKYTFVNICKEDKSLELGDDAIKIFLTPDSTADGEHKVVESKLTHSKNLIIPQPEEKAISGWKLKDAPRIPKGWYLIKESYFEGVNMEGYKYRTYKMARLKPLPPRDRSWRPPGRGRGRTNAGRYLYCREQ